MGASENLLGRLQAWSDVFPDAPACRSAGEVLSYAQLWQRAGVLAAGLRRDHGIANGDPVGLVATESVEFLCGLAGIARAGAAFVPLDPEMPARRREQLLRAAGVRLVLAPGAAGVSGRSTLCLDRFDWRSATREAPEPVPAEACQLAYICFTSGSTGEPAGVEVDHHNVAQYANALAARLAPPPGLTFLPLASLATDHAYTAVFGALFTGGCVELLPASVRQDAVALAAATADHRPDYIKAVPGHLLALHRAGAPLLPHRGLILGGEPLRYGQVRELLQADGGCAVFNHYGPTETTIGVCMHNVDPTAPRADDQPVPLGSPLGDNALELQDPDGGPNEEEGEIVIRGPAVARGYRGSNARAGRFSGDGSERSYRTGDLGRINAEGLVEFVGRVDDELKLRGFRINPRETEGIIRMHPDVQDCLVTPVRDENDAPVSLVARVELKPDTVSRKQERERVHHWRSVHEDKYARASAAPRTTGGQTMAGWRNSYDGLAFPAAEMEEWTTGTLQRIRALGARSIYEAGCGAGLLALPLAGHARYTGSDFSSGALALLREQLEEAGHGDVRLHQCEARDVGFLEGERFDLVVLNSVLQHFPGPGYLEDVLKALVSVAAPGGRIFIGDVRDLERLEWFHFSRQLFLSPGSRDIAELLERVAASVAAEHELVVAPEWFRQFAERQGWQARAMPKAGRYRNEMNRFRYDAVLFAGMDPAQDDRFEQVQAPRPGEIKELLAEGPAGLHVTGLCDARAADIARHFRLAQELTGNVAELREQIRREQDAETGMEPQVVEQIADRAGYDATLVLETGERPGQFEAWFVRRGFHATGAQARGPAKQPVARPHTNDPQENERRRRFPTQLRTFLRERLPAHLVPAQVGCVDRLPRLANGKPDRRAGPLPTGDRGDEPVRPRNSVEAWLQNIWQELLGHAPIGVHDDFFEHGGHSLLAVQLLTRATGANGRTLDHEAFLRSPTISGMAALLAGSPKADARPEPGADTGNGAGDRTLSAAERRLWVASVLDPDPAAFNVCYRVDFTRGPDEATLEEALGRLCQRHPALRSTFPAPGRDPVRCVLPAFRPPLQVIDQPRRALDDFIEEELARPHSLESSPPVRCT
ncbi:MAG: AMP-binding protein, partial [Gammaproteobacteria bacterium]|nr:AMP-binding protein [Gammaproteobacteria bacterium]